MVFSAHGVAPSVHTNAAARGLRVIDATCPLVTKVHPEARHFAGRGYTIILIGHEGHEEVEGTMGEAPDATRLVGTVDEVASSPTSARYAARRTSRRRRCASTRRATIIAALKARFPHIEAPQEGRHLLRDLEPPGGREGAGAGGRPGAGDRVAEQLQLEPAGRGGA